MEKVEPKTKLAVGRKEAAAMLSISVETLDRLVKRGLLRPSRATRRPLFSVKDLEQFLDETKQINWPRHRSTSRGETATHQKEKYQ